VTASQVLAAPAGLARDQAIDAWCVTVWSAFNGRVIGCCIGLYRVEPAVVAGNAQIVRQGEIVALSEWFDPEMNMTVYKNYRRGLVRRFPYAVFYEYIGDMATIYGIFHTASNPRKWRLRLS